MEIQISEEHEDLSAEWQYQMILLLKEILIKKGIDENKAKEIIGDFAFDFAMLHDQGEIKFEGASYNPRISFFDFKGKLLTTDEDTSLHDFAFGSTSEAFGE